MGCLQTKEQRLSKYNLDQGKWSPEWGLLFHLVSSRSTAKPVSHGGLGGAAPAQQAARALRRRGRGTGSHHWCNWRFRRRGRRHCRRGGGCWRRGIRCCGAVGGMLEELVA